MCCHLPRRSPLIVLVSFAVALIVALLLPLLSPVLPGILAQNSAYSRSASAPSSEIRGVWLTNVDSTVLFDPETLDRSLTQLKQLHFNTVYPVVWNWGYTLYPSAVMAETIGHQLDPRPRGLRDRDPLAELIEIGHQHQIAVLPWFEFGFMTNVNSEIILAHPEWVTQRQDGSQIWQEGIWSRRWLNPFHPEVQQFIQDLVLEIVTQYQIDGIQFDDHFGLPYEFGYDDYTVQLYRQEHHGKAPPADPQNAEWTSWRADKITAFMAHLFTEIKAQKREAIVSLSPNRYDFSYRHSLQDWRTWERQGLIEELLVQVYTNDPNQFATELNRPEVQEARQHIPTAVGILTGLKQRSIPIQQIQDQVEQVRQQQFAGVSFFFFETLWNLSDEPAEVRQAGLRSMFANPVERPRLEGEE